MASTRIPKFNEEFDPKLFRFIFLKKLPLIIILFVLFFLSAFLMLRYTQPVFEANTIIQIETENKAEEQEENAGNQAKTEEQQ